MCLSISAQIALGITVTNKSVREDPSMSLVSSSQNKIKNL